MSKTVVVRAFDHIIKTYQHKTKINPIAIMNSRATQGMHTSRLSTVAKRSRVGTTHRTTAWNRSRCEGGLGRRANAINGRQWRAFSLDGAKGGSGGSGGGIGKGKGGGGVGGQGPNSSGGGDSQPMGLLAMYLALMDKYPVPVKLVTTAVLNFGGDLMSQLGIEKSKFDWKRSAIFTFLGFALVGPCLHFWYLGLSKIVAGMGLVGNTGAMASLLLDQFVFAPVFIGMFLASLVTLQGKMENIPEVLKNDWFDSVTLNWRIWLPCQFFNFRYVPQNYQVLFANFVALIWNTALSYVSHRNLKVEA